MLSMADVAVIIPVYNDSLRLDKCLRALAAQSYSGGAINVLVVDNNSSEDIESVVVKYANANYLFESNPGAYYARNKAIAELRQEQFIAFTDSDCIPEFDWINSAVSMLHSHPKAAVGGKVEVFAANEKPTLAEHYELLFAFPQETYIKSDHFAVTANLVMRRETLNAVGSFNTKLFSGGDAEFGNRLKEKGFSLVYGDNVVVRHPARSSVKQLTSKERRTVGGCYQQRNTNPVMKKSFSFMSLLKGYIPPLRAWRDLLDNDSLSTGLKLRVACLATFIKYRKNTLKIGYRLHLLRNYERF